MNVSFQKPNVWARVFSNIEPAETDAANRLQTSFQSFRNRSAKLLERIATSLPSLTVHDITHIDALWETASLIIGPSYPLNPMEVYMLGGAMLLHDAALCFEAYKDGLVGIRRTQYWQDAYSAELDRNKERNEPLHDAELQANADFSTVRLLHADQAPALVEAFWLDNDTSNQIFLIDDTELRKHFGSIIGQIAASHNWNIEDLEARLPAQMNAPGNWPSNWRIDPIKLACILRCADAAHIDARRAPDFLYALTRREEISLDHWKAQNWLARADLDQSDPSNTTLLFTSNREFEPDDASAWWIAYDSVRLVEKEISQCNELLSSRPQKHASPEFAIRQIAGASSPQAMNRYLRTRKWKPSHAELHVGNMERLVKNLGGKNLYGGDDTSEHFAIVLRELLQNSRDAIIARQKLDEHYQGAIKVRLLDSNPATLEVADDGVGMSHRVMTGPLLDFGSSFWKSDLVREEFPGLRSSGFNSVGQFGIGFYSTFMVANAVKVTSRRWDKGQDTSASVSFPRGLTLRPIFSADETEKNIGSMSTVVTCLLKTGDSPPSERIYRINNNKNITVPFIDFVRRLVVGLDVSVDVSVNGSAPVKAHVPIQNIVENDVEKINWLRHITLSQHIQLTSVDLEDISRRLRPIYVDGSIVGLAALSLKSNRHGEAGGIGTVGGFLPGGYSGVGGHRNFFGYMEQIPNSAKREAGKRAAPQSIIEDWVKTQLALLSGHTFTPEQRFWLSYNLCDLDFDPTPYLFAPFSKNTQLLFLNLDQVFEAMKKNESVAFFNLG